MTSYAEALNDLPPFIRGDFFKKKPRYPKAFMAGIASSSPHIFRDMDSVAASETWEEIKDRFKVLHRYAQDFYGQDNGTVDIPSYVYEAFAILCHGGNNAAQITGLSEPARIIIEDVSRLRGDPYPRQNDHTSVDARFLFLLTTLINMPGYASFYAKTPAPERNKDPFYLEFLLAMRTLDGQESALEFNILRNIQRIEFMLDFEDHPYFSKHLNLLRTFAADSLAAEELLKKLDLPATDTMVKALALADLEFENSGLTGADKTLAIMLTPCAQTRMLMDFLPDVGNDFLVFSMLLPFMQSDHWEGYKNQWFGETAEQYDDWYNWIAHGEEPEKPLSQNTIGMLSNILAASDIVQIERISLLLKQDEKKYKPVMYEHSLIEAKVSLMRVRSTAQILSAADPELRKTLSAMMSSAFNDLHALSGKYPFLQHSIDLQSGVLIYDEPSL